MIWHAAPAVSPRNFSRLGYDVTGADISCEMLSVAENKCSGNASFVCADMRDFAFSEPFDACVCCLDSINHLDSINDVAKTFKCVYNSLKPGGIFLCLM
ncbi:MAG: class I SAM-dependent methyltransferase [Anaerotruncus sp.]|nr:MAG: class I SAM-dependent methyltransferase [Anaerotruncus sp.]